MKVARDGQQSGNESTALVNFVPWAASSLRTFGICARSAAAWSSVMTTRMFGGPSFWAPAGRAVAGPAALASSESAASAARISRAGLIAATVQRVSHGVNFSVSLRTMATSKAAVRQTRQESRERIVAAATELIRHTAYGALTVDAVMRGAGAGRTIFYRHFDDLADLLMRAGREAFEGLYEAERTLSEAAAGSHDDLTVVRAAIEPAVAVYERHGPLMRAVAEAAALGDERIAAGRAAWRERFDELVADILRDTVPGDAAETAR